ncbi:MAG TPA: helix-turn-helix domain-containing protein [Allosphingosinicella sp.]|nr:helix-turn-helix domain-containing protein [Allosphingosinicella sp.]
MVARIEFPPLPASVAMLPFLFARRAAGDDDWNFHAALGAAVAAEGGVEDRRSTRRRVAWLLCELGQQYGRRTGDYHLAVPISRQALAQALGLGLSRVKRVLALLSLSQAIECGEGSIRITDWRRLCGMAGYDCAMLGFALPEEDELAATLSEMPPRVVTAGGDPAYFG